VRGNAGSIPHASTYDSITRNMRLEKDTFNPWFFSSCAYLMKEHWVVQNAIANGYPCVENGSRNSSNDTVSSHENIAP
jgi:hypothetical protein